MEINNLKDIEDKAVLVCFNCKYTDIASVWKNGGEGQYGKCKKCGSRAFIPFGESGKEKNKEKGEGSQDEQA
jgi:predicted nucleic-acid-binding Zn-ribbon protein